MAMPRNNYKVQHQRFRKDASTFTIIMANKHGLRESLVMKFTICILFFISPQNLVELSKVKDLKNLAQGCMFVHFFYIL